MAALDFQGICYGLEQGNGLSCRVAPTGAGLALNFEGKPTLNVGYPELKVSLSGVEDRYLCFEARQGDAELRILVADRGILERIRDLGAPGRFLTELDRIVAERGRRVAFRWAILGAVAGFVALVVAVVWFGLNLAVAAALRAVPVEWEEELGRVSAGQLLAQEKVCSDPELAKALDEIAMRLISGLGASYYSFKFRILDNGEVNAFALPGGYVFVNRGLIDRADDGAEIAGVIAHEIQHVLNRDGLNNVTRQAGAALVLGAVMGDAGGLELFIAHNAAGMASMSFSRDLETRADKGGLELMRRSGLDQTGLPRFLKKLAAEEGTLSSALTIISSHPASKERVKELEDMIGRESKPSVVPLKSNLDAVRGRCSPVSLAEPDGP